MSATLDLEKIDSLSLENETHLKELASLIVGVCNENQSYFSALARDWEYCIRFYQGDQYLTYNDVTGRWQSAPSNKYLDAVPRRVNNYIQPNLDALVALFTKGKPNCDIPANSTDVTDRDAAKLAGVLQDAKWELDEEQEKLIKALFISSICGTVFRKDSWNPSIGPKIQVKDEATGQMVENTAGDNEVSIIDPFRMLFDVQDETWFIESSLKPLWWVRLNYDQTGNGFTGLAKTVKEQKHLTTMLDLQVGLKTFTGKQVIRESDDLKGMVRFDECYIQPTKNHPEGVMIILAGGVPVFASASPYWDHASRYPFWHPYTPYKWKELYFRSHGQGAVSGMIPYQRAINAIENFIALNIAVNVSPIWTSPIGCGVEADHILGKPGLVLKYNPVGAGGAGPQRMPGSGLPSDVFNYLGTLKQDLQMFVKMNDVLRGIQPKGVGTAAQLQMLLEQSFSTFGPDIQRLDKFIEKGQTKKLLLIQRFYKQYRPDLVSQLKAINKDNLDVEIRNFLGADLHDNVNVRIEAGSTLPRLKAFQTQNYKELAQMGMFGPIDPMTNPVGNAEFLEEMGVTKFATQSNTDVKRANWVNSVLKEISEQISSGQQPTTQYPQFQPWELNPQVLMIHEKVLTDFMKSPSFNDQSGVFMQRYNEIQQIKGMLAAQAAQAQAAQAQPPQPLQGGPSPQELTPQGQGLPPVETGAVG